MRRGPNFCATDDPSVGEQLAGAPLFGQPQSRAVAEAKRTTLAERHAADIERLRPLVRELAERAGGAGITVGDIRLVAEQRGLLDRGSGRSLSWLTALPRACGLVSTGRRRMSPLVRSRNDHAIYRLPGGLPPRPAA